MSKELLASFVHILADKLDMVASYYNTDRGCAHVTTGSILVFYLRECIKNIRYTVIKK